jgi:hypothetical protein
MKPAEALSAGDGLRHHVARCRKTGRRDRIAGKISLPTYASRRCFVVSSRRTVIELLDALAAVMAERDPSWYLFGAQAAIVWGSPRLIADVDVTAAIEPAIVGSFIDSMRQHGFDLVLKARCDGAQVDPKLGDRQ